MDDHEWLLFLAQLPSTPSSLRVNVWRRLRETGSISLQNGVWVLPRSAENSTFLERLLAFVRQSGAGGQIFRVLGLDQAVDGDVIARFKAERTQEFDEFLEQCEVFIGELDKETRRQKFTFTELEENEQNLQRLRKWITKIQKRDFFKTNKSQEAIAAYQGCKQMLDAFTRQVYHKGEVETFSELETFSDESGSKDLV
jgi:hypothetical protein